MRDPELAPLIAVVGSDGSGKSTVCAALAEWLNERRPTEIRHLGKQSGNMGRAIARVPLIGKRADDRIVAKASKARDDDGPSGATALVIYLLSMRRVRRFRRMLTARKRGIAVIGDRYPQVGVPGPMDGMGLYAPNPKSGIARWLGVRERAHYEWMEQTVPDLVIQLNVDLETAVARKPDHRYSSLKAKIEAVPRLSFNGAPIVDIDATLPLDRVLAQAKAAVTAALDRIAAN